MSGRPLLLVTLPVLTVVAICLYLRRRGRTDSETGEETPEMPQQATADSGGSAARASESVAPVSASAEVEPKSEPARAEPEPEPAVVCAKSAAVTSAQPPASKNQTPMKQTPKPAPAELAAAGDALSQLEAAIQPSVQKEQPDGGVAAPEAGDAPPAKTVEKQTTVVKEEPKVAVQESAVAKQEAPVTAAEPAAATAAGETADWAKTEAPVAEATTDAATEATPAAEAASETPETPSASTSGAEAAGAAENGAADTASENSSDSGKGGSSASLEPGSSSASPESAPGQTTVYDFLIPQKLCGRLIGKNGTFVNMLKARTGAHVIIRLHPVKSSVKICSVDGTQTEIDACLKMIREKFPLSKFPAMTLEQLNRPTEQSLAVPDSQQLHLPQGVTCDVLVSAVVSAGQIFLQQHTHPTFRGLERLTTLMAACYADGSTTPELPRPVVPSCICAAPVAGGWYRAQVVAYYPDTDEIDVRFMDFGGYSRIPAALARQIRTDFMSLPFQAEECYLANVMPLSDEGWGLEEGAVFESLIADRALEAMVVGYAEDGTPFVNLFSIQGTEYGNNVITLVNQRLVDSGGARWVENQA